MCHPETCAACVYKTASRSVIETASPDYVYAAIVGIEGSVFNENWDYWDWDDELCRIKTAGAFKGQPTWATWRGKPVCTNHPKEIDPLKDVYGKVCDCYPNHQNKNVQMLVAVDKQRDPSVARGIENGVLNTFSMGCRVAYSNCTYCGHKAALPKDYCECVKTKRGRLMPRRDGMNHFAGVTEHNMVRVGELCHDSDGIEISIVTRPAFPNCVTLDVLELTSKIASLGASLARSSAADEVRAGKLLIKCAAADEITDEHLAAVQNILLALNNKIA